MAAFIKSLSRFLGGNKPEPAVHLAAFGKHPGWNDHLDDLGLDTDALIAAKRLLYAQGINQNIDAGAWEKLDPAPATAAAPARATGRLERFRHDLLWQMPDPDGDAPLLLAGRLWSSSDGKGRDKYPMVVCSQLTQLPAGFASAVVLPFLVDVQAKCESTTSAEIVRQILQTERDNLRAKIKDAQPPPRGEPLTPKRLAAIANCSDMLENHIGFHRIVYQFASGLAAYRTPAAKSTGPRRPEQLRLPACDMSPPEALLFWLRFALTFVDPSTPLLLIAPDQAAAPWVDLIAGEPSPANIFCIKAGTGSLPLTSDIPYTLDPGLVRTIDTHIAFCQSAADSTPLPPWPMFQ